MREFFKFGSDIKSKGGLYCLVILFVVCAFRFILGERTVSILFVLQSMVVGIVIALFEYFLFQHYEELSKEQKNKRTVVWYFAINGIVLLSAYYFGWTQGFPNWLIIVLIAMLEIALVFFRYNIYIKNYYDTKQLNDKLQKFQSQK